MSLEFLIILVFGAVTGCLAALYVKGESFGLWADVAIGLLGGLIGGWIVAALGIGGGIVAAIITGIAGAIILICIFRVVKLQTV